MKDFKFYLWFIIVAIGLFTAACDDDSEENTPVFPQLQKIDCTVGEDRALNFDASDSWTLTSSALWCTFIVEGEQVYSCTGNAGQSAVTIHISNEATELMKSYKADLNLMMGGAQSVIYEVTRPDTGYELHVYNADQSAEYSEENPYLQDYEGLQSMVVTVNADWVIEAPGSLDLSFTNTYGMAGELVTIQPKLQSGLEHRKESWQQQLTFKNKNNEVMAVMPVHYDGIPADKVEFSNQDAMAHVITYNYDGYSYTINEEERDAPMPLTVAAKDDKYTMVYVEYSQIRNDFTWEYEYYCNLMTEEDSWIFVDDNMEGDLSVYMSNNGGEARDAFLMAFPTEVYELVKADFDNMVFSKEEGIVFEYEQYVAGRFNQKANPKLTSGFKVSDMEYNPLYDTDGLEIETISYIDAVGDKTEAELIQEYGTSNVYILSLPLGVPYENMVVQPKGFTGYYIQAAPLVLWDGVEVGMFSMLETIIMGIGESTNGIEPMSVAFIDPEGTTYAVMLISRY